MANANTSITIVDHEGLGTITNDDTATLFVVDVARQEGDQGITPFEFQLVLDKPVSRDFTVDFTTEDGSAVAGADYQTTSGTRVFRAGDTTGTVTIDVVADEVVEQIEGFVLRVGNISDPGVVFSSNAASIGAAGTVLDDDFTSRNVSPVLLGQLADITLVVGRSFTWTIPGNTFFDDDGDALTITASTNDGARLPGWLSFDATTRKLSGVPESGDIGTVQVRVAANDGHQGSTSATFDINVVLASGIPKQRTVTSHAVGSFIANLTPTFTWTDDANAASFDFSVFKLPSGPEVIRTKTLTTNSFTPTDRLSEGTFDIRVRARNSNGVFGPWNSPHLVTIQSNRPARPVPLGPSGTINSGKPTFTWTQDVNTDNVELSIVQSESGTEVARHKNIQGTSFTLTSPLPAGNYHYNLQAWNQLRQRSGWTSSTTFSVVLVVPTAAPQFTAPGATTQSDATPNIAWQAVANGALYNLQVTNTTTNVVVVNRTGLTSTFFQTTSPLPSGTYEARVTATNEAGVAGPSSSPHAFTIALAAPPRPVIEVPGANISNPRPTFAWAPITDAVTYQLWLRNNDTAESPYLRMVGLTSSSATATRDLVPGNYSLWVKILNADGAHRWSLEHTFTVILALSGSASQTTAPSSTAAHGDDVFFSNAEQVVDSMT